MTKWTTEDEQKLRAMYEADTPAGVIGYCLGRTASAVYARAAKLDLSDPKRSQRVSRSMGDERALPAYRGGRKARNEGREKIPPGTIGPVQRAWWLAGFHDMDMELGVSVLA